MFWRKSISRRTQNMTVLVCMELEIRTKSAVWSWVRSGGKGGKEGSARMAITTIVFHRLSFIKPDKLLKDLLSDCCWYVARKQPSVSVSESTRLLSCAREEEEEEEECSCSGGGSSRWHSWLLSHEQPWAKSVAHHKPSAPLLPPGQSGCTNSGWSIFLWGALQGIEIMNMQPLREVAQQAEVSGIN